MKTLATTLCILLSLAAPALASIDASTGAEARPSAYTPLPQGERDLAVLWDTSHGVYLSYDPTGSYSQLASLLASNGYSLTVTVEGIEAVDLSAFDVLVLALTSAWLSPYTESEADAVVNFVSGGGAVLVMSDNPYCPVQNLSPILARFGLASGMSDLQPSDLTITSFIDNPIFAGITSVYFRAAGGIFAAAPSVAAALAPGGSSAMGLYPSCHVFLTGDANFCDNDYMINADNEIFVTSLFAALGDCGAPTAVERASWGKVKTNY